MDWRRARAYLILAFTLLNLFLGYRLWSEHQLRRGDCAPAGILTHQRGPTGVEGAPGHNRAALRGGNQPSI